MTNPTPSPLVVITLRGGLVEDVNATAAIRVIIEDWDCPDWDTGKRPTRSAYPCDATLPPAKAQAKYLRLTADAEPAPDTTHQGDRS